MSKFFKALERVEQEQEPAAAAARTEPAAAAASAEPAAPATPVAPAPPPAPKRAEPVAVTPKRAEPPAPTPIHPQPKIINPPAPAPTPAPVVRLETSMPSAAPTYGAPVATDSGAGFGTKGFAWQIEPDADAELGQVDDHLVSVLEPTSLAAEQYRAVRLAIETFRHERGTRTVAITSPARGDGRTITAINVAGALAQAPDARVVLVEVDLRHPGVARALGMPAGRGLSSYLLDASMAPDAVISRPSNIAFAVVTAGAASSMPYEMLKSPRLAAFLAALRERFDYVVLDTPPALPYPDVGILRDIVDGFVVVVRANRTPREMLRDCTNVIGRQKGDRKSVV